MQSTANALGILVVAGPVEATSCGNVITQMVATGSVATFAEGRDLVRNSFDFTHYNPRGSNEWNSAYEKFLKLLGIDRST